MLVGKPFMKDNDIVLDIPGDHIIVYWKHIISRFPVYNRENLEELQDKMDELERQGVLAKQRRCWCGS